MFDEISNIRFLDFDVESKDFTDPSRNSNEDGWITFSFIFDPGPVQAQTPNLLVQSQPRQLVNVQTQQGNASWRLPHVEDTLFDRHRVFVEVLANTHLEHGYSLNNMHHWDRDHLKVCLVSKRKSVTDLVNEAKC